MQKHTVSLFPLTTLTKSTRCDPPRKQKQRSASQTALRADEDEDGKRHLGRALHHGQIDKRARMRQAWLGTKNKQTVQNATRHRSRANSKRTRISID